VAASAAKPNARTANFHGTSRVMLPSIYSFSDVARALPFPDRGDAATTAA